MTHQRQKALVGPTSSGKVYDKDEDADDEYSLNLEIRTKTMEVRKSIAWLEDLLLILFLFFNQINAQIAIMALKIGAPKEYMQLLQEHADITNLPRVGVDENVAFPAVQANIAPAVSLDNSLGIILQQHIYLLTTYLSDKGLESSMGFFGMTDGHTDDGDDEAGLTCMISNSCIPEDYEASA